MKKRSIWILMISALLCLSMLLAACDSDDASGTDTSDVVTTDGDETTNRDTKPKGDNVISSEFVKEWTAYITPVEKEPTERNNYNGLETVKDYTGYTRLGKFYYKTTTDVVSTPDGNRNRTTVNIYNSKLNLLKTYTQSSYDTAHGDWTVDYDYSVFADGWIIEVEKSVWTADGMEYYYNYYDIGGKDIIGQTSDSQAMDYDFCIVYGEKSYHVNDEGEIFLVAHATENYRHEYEFDFTYTTADGKEYGYKLDESNNTMKVYKDYVVVAECNRDDDYYILDNGDIYFCDVTALGKNATIFDYETLQNKYDVKHTLISVATGEAKSLDLPFVLTNMLTNEQTKETGIKLKTGTQYAEITRIVDGKLALAPEFVIVDNSLAEVVKLPKLLENQAALGGSLGTSKFIISVDRAYADDASYTVDVNKSTLERYSALPVGAQPIDGGYLYNQKIYSTAGKLELDLTGANYCYIEFGNVRYSFGSTYINYNNGGETENNTVTSIAYFDGNGVFHTTAIATSTSQSKSEDIVTVTTQTINSHEANLYLVEETVMKSGSPSVKNYKLYNRSGSLIQAFYDCTSAYISGYSVPVRVSVEADGQTTTYIIK